MFAKGSTIVNKSELYKLYIEQGLSGRESAEILGVGKTAVLNVIKESGWSRSNLQHRDKYGRCIKKGQVLPVPEGENSPVWKGGSVNYYKRLAFKNLENCCDICKSKRKLQVHHKDRNRKNNKLSNLQILCSKCHNNIVHEGMWMENKTRDHLGRFAPL